MGRDTAQADVLIVGAGMAGLACAVHLARAGLRPLVIEASDRVGGRVHTDRVDGFLLDRGFQVLLDAYPEVRGLLDLKALGLRRFEPGALIRTGGRFVRMSDPFRRPLKGLATLFAPVGSFGDKLRIARLRGIACRGTLADLLSRPELTAVRRLRQLGFTDGFIDTFFRPFLGGIFLEQELATSSRMLEFVFRMFSTGSATLPAAGMGAVPAQLAAGLPDGCIRFHSPVRAASAGSVELETGETLSARSVVLATDGRTAARLTGATPPPMRAVRCIHFAAQQAPLDEPILVLNGAGAAGSADDGPVNNMCVPSAVAPGYAPSGQALISCTVLGSGEPDDGPRPDDLGGAVRAQMREWFGSQVDGWRHLRTDVIGNALPRFEPPTRTLAGPGPDARGLICCGDFMSTPSLQGALESGRWAAEAAQAGARRP